MQFIRSNAFSVSPGSLGTKQGLLPFGVSQDSSPRCENSRLNSPPTRPHRASSADSSMDPGDLNRSPVAHPSIERVPGGCTPMGRSASIDTTTPPASSEALVSSSSQTSVLRAVSSQPVQPRLRRVALAPTPSALETVELQRGVRGHGNRKVQFPDLAVASLSLASQRGGPVHREVAMDQAADGAVMDGHVDAPWSELLGVACVLASVLLFVLFV